MKEKRVPQDHETFLSGDDFKRTKIRVKGATVYAKDGLYYYRDTLHVGEAAHIEVFDHTGKNIWGKRIRSAVSWTKAKQMEINRFPSL
ncbi:hypothetical protein QKW52_10270 [Bacillus sonorensis]|nr:hypothetical protein [Bacillus sonorensis]